MRPPQLSGLGEDTLELPPFSPGSFGHLRGTSIPMDSHWVYLCCHTSFWPGGVGGREEEPGWPCTGIRGLVLTHPGSLIQWLDLSLGDPLVEFPLGCGRGQLRTGPAGPSRTLAPALRHSTSQQHAAPAVREAVITQVGGGARAMGCLEPLALATFLPPPQPATSHWPWMGRTVRIPPRCMCGCTARKRLIGTTLKRPLIKKVPSPR